MLDRERARVYRSGHEFSLVAFEAASTGQAQHLGPILRERARCTDEVGWLDEQRIAILLPDTPSEGACRVADDVCQRMAHSGTPPTYTLYTYPSKEWFGKGRPAKQPEEGKWLFARPTPLWKRSMDVAGALLALILFAPLFLLIAGLIKILSPGPVFFKQERVGYLGKPFTLWKFRTMRADADASPHKEYLTELIRASDRPMAKLDEDHDPRIIPLGRFLRTTCLDEMPQLINVLLGEMSLVGPRPCLPYEAENYHLWHTGRFDATPGMTGLWQISGKNKVSFNEMVRLDIAYTRDRSLWMDVKILLKTIPAVLTS